MSHSYRLRFSEIRKLHDLLEQVSSLGLDPTRWRSHMLQELCALTHARVGLTTDVQQALPGNLMQFVEPVAVGFSPQEVRSFGEFIASDDRLVDPGGLAVVNHHARRRFVTALRHEMVDSEQWYSSPVVSEGRRSANIDHYLLSSMAVGKPGWLTGFVLYRSWDDAPFDERDRRIARIFHTFLLRRLHLGKRTDDRSNLPVYLRQMLRSLLLGHNTQEAAEALGLSVHTIKTYTKEIYARLDIRSRGELAARLYGHGASPPIFLPAAFDAAY